MAFNPWVIAAEIGLSIGLNELQKWLSNPPPDDRPRQMSNVPSTADGSPIPAVFGKIRVRRPVLVWHGGFKQYSDLAIHGPNIDIPNVDHWFGLNLLFAVGLPHSTSLSKPAVALTGIYFDDRKLEVNLGHEESVALGNQANELDGRGRIQFFAGGAAQLVSNYNADINLETHEIAYWMRHPDGAAVDHTLIPGYRNQMLVAFSGNRDHALHEGEIQAGEKLGAFIFGPTTALPEISVEVMTLDFRYTALHPNDACPMAVARQVLTGGWGFCGIDETKIDEVSFGACAVTLAAEGNGYSREIDTQRSGKDVIQELANQIGGVFYQDHVTGKVHAKLLRDDFNPATIPYFEARHVERVERCIKHAQIDRINRVVVGFNNRELGYVNDTVTVPNQAVSVLQSPTSGGSLRVVPLEYPGVMNPTQASRLGERDMKLLSQPLAQLRIVFNRLLDVHGTSNAPQLRPGSVFKLNLPDHKIYDEIYRVTKVDPGQHGDGKVTVDATTDVFRAGARALPTEQPEFFIPVPVPLRHRVLTEAPRWIQLHLTNQGVFGNPDVQRALAAARPLDAATHYSVATNAFGGPLGAFPLPAQPDLELARFPLTAKVATAYGRENDPYDDTTGLVITGFLPNEDAGTFVLNGVVWDPDDIRANGSTLIMINGEILAYESATDLGGAPRQWRLNKVWRSLLDTASRDHAVGDIVYFLAFGTVIDRVGKRGWSSGKKFAGTWFPKLGFVPGSGDDPSDTVVLRQRCQLPVRVADMALVGKNMLGTTGIPVAAGFFKRVTLLEEGIDLFALRRDRKTGTVVRGDAADETQTELGIGYVVTARKGTALPVTLTTLGNAAIAGGHALLLGGAGHGEIDVKITTARAVASGDGTIGIPIGTLIECWDPPTVRVTAPVWRNLLANSRFDYNNLTAGWVVQQGNCGVGNDSSSIPRDASGFYFQGTASGVAPTIKQTIDVSGYLPRKLGARLVYYQRALNADTNDTATATLDPLDSGGSSLGGAATQTIATVATNWNRTSLLIAALPANTAKLAVTFALNEVATLGSTTAEAAIAECELIVGNHLYDVLANGSFETGTTASWTNVTNSFVVATTIRSPSGNYAQGGAFAASAIRQDYALLAGWEVGSVVVLRCWRAQTIAGDTGRVRLQCLDGGGGVLATADTGVENLATLNQWVRRRLHVTVPVGTVTVRVLLDAVRTGGAGNSGACFDEHVLSVHKELDAVSATELVFDTPTVHPAPATWQDWTLELPALYDAGVRIPIVFAGAEPSVNIGTHRIVKAQWSDGVARAPTKLVGLFGAGVTSIDAYKFTRQSGAGALDYQVAQEVPGKRFMNPTSAEPFSVIVEFMIDEAVFNTACGLTGRRDASAGWDLGIDATGHVSAVVQGTLGTKTATRPATVVHDGAFHLAAIVYDPVAQTVTAYDERGGTSTSTAAGLGEIANAAVDCKLRIGRGRTTVDTIPGLIARVYFFPGVVLSSAQVLAHWNYAKDPTGLLTTYARTAAALVPIAPDALGNEQACMLAVDQVALSYRSVLTLDNGTGYGLAVGRAAQNLIPSFDFAGASWVKDAGATLTQSIVDLSGRPRGVRVAGDAANGFKVIGVPLGAAAAVFTTSLWARSVSGSTTLDVEILTSADVVEQTLQYTLTTAWKRFDSVWTWLGATATGRFRFKSNAGAIVFELAGAFYCGLAGAGTNPNFPALIPLAASTHGNYNAVANVAMPTQFNREGELMAEGSMLSSSWASLGEATIVRVKNGANDKNRRELQQRAAGGGNDARLAHWDGQAVPVSVTSDLDYTHWHDRVWKVRGRWCALGLNDVTAGRFAHVAIGDHVTPAPTEGAAGRVAIWTNDTTQSTAIEIGTGTAAPEDMILRRVIARAREEKLA